MLHFKRIVYSSIIISINLTTPFIDPLFSHIVQPYAAVMDLWQSYSLRRFILVPRSSQDAWFYTPVKVTGTPELKALAGQGGFIRGETTRRGRRRKLEKTDTAFISLINSGNKNRCNRGTRNNPNHPEEDVVYPPTMQLSPLLFTV